jgi:hypothetical protein
MQHKNFFIVSNQIFNLGLKPKAFVGYSGLLYRTDCNSKLYFIRGTTLKTDAYGFICSRHRKHLGDEQCTPHSIRAKVLDEIIFEEIRKVTYYARVKPQGDARVYKGDRYSAEGRELRADLP